MARDIEKHRRSNREHMARKRAGNPEAARAYSRRFYHRKHEHNLAVMTAYQQRRFFWRRVMTLKGKDRATTADLSRIWKNQRGRCALTGRRLNRENAHLDHIIAKARGGSDRAVNLRWVCKEVNMARRDLADAEFLALCADVLRHSSFRELIG